MIGDKQLLAIVPARGGSKRLPGKNIMDLAGKPLIAWTIEAALNSQYIDRVIVSTDDEEIASIGKRCGADVPFLRPQNLAVDDASSIDTVINVLEEIESIDKYYEYVVLLQPTSPLRTSKHIDNAVELMQRSESYSIISMCEAEHPPQWSGTLSDDHNLCEFLDYSIINRRSQELDKYYRVNGAIYLCDSDKIMQEKTFFTSGKCKAFIMEQEMSVDIDTKMDFDIAGFLIRQQN